MAEPLVSFDDIPVRGQGVPPAARSGARPLVSFDDIPPAGSPATSRAAPLVSFDDIPAKGAGPVDVTAPAPLGGVPSIAPAKAPGPVRFDDIPARPGAMPAAVPPPGMMGKAGAVLSDMGSGVVEAPRQVVGGVRDATQSAWNAQFGLLQWMRDKGVPLLNYGPDGVSVGTGGQQPRATLPSVSDAESVTGGLVRGISQFLTGFLPAGSLAGVGKAATTLGNFGRAAGAGAAADFSVFEPSAHRLADLVEQFPALSNPVTAYLKSDKDDGEVEGRLKNVLEGLGAGVMVEGFVQGLRGLKAMRAARVAGEAADGTAASGAARNAADATADNLAAARVESAAADATAARVQAGTEANDVALDALERQVADLEGNPLSVAAPDADAVAKFIGTRTPQQLEQLRASDPSARGMIDAELARRGMEPPAPREPYAPPAAPVKPEAPESLARQITTASGKKATVAGPLDLVTWLRTKGGLDPDSFQGGDLRAMDLHRLNGRGRDVEFARNEHFLGSIVRKGGMDLDTAAHDAWEAGYLPGVDRPDINALLDAVDDTVRATNNDQRAFTQADRDLLASRSGPMDYDRAAHDLGIDTTGMSPADVAREVEVRISAPETDLPAGLSRSEVEAAAPPVGDALSRQGQEALDAINARGTVDPGTTHAGNIRLAGIQTADDVRKVVTTISDQNAAFGGARRGVVSDRDLRELASDLGIDESRINRRGLGDAWNAEGIYAARQLLANSAEALQVAARAARGGDDAALLAFSEAYTRHVAIQEQVAGLTAEAGRALRQFQPQAPSEKAKLAAIKGIINRQGGKEKLGELVDMLSALDDPAAVNMLSREAFRPGFMGKAREYWINALLSGPTTHAVNITSNALTFLYTLPEDLLSAGFGMLRGGTDKRFLREPMARAFGIVEGARDGLRAFAKQAISGENALDPAFSKLEGVHAPAIGGKLGSVIRIPTRLLAAEDAFFKAVAFRTEINAQAVRTAAREGLSGAAFAKRVAELRNAPSSEMVDEAITRARVLTFTNPLGSAGNALSLARNRVWGAAWVVPFLKTPLNILSFAARRTPFGLAMKDVRESLAAGGRSRDDVLAQMTLGTTAALATASYAKDGTITGGGPSDAKERQALMATGWRPYSAKIGDKWYSYNRLDPLGMLMGLAADTTEAIDAADDKTAIDIAAGLSGAFAKTLLDKSYLRGISDFVNAVNDPDRYAERFLKGFAASFVPNAAGQVARSMDPIARETYGLLDEVKARVPGWSESLYPRRDVWGQPITRDAGAYGDGVAGRLLSPAKVSEPGRDALTTEMLRLKLVPSKAPASVLGVELTPAQKDQWAEFRGRFVRHHIDRLVGSDRYRSWPDSTKRAALDDALGDLQGAARNIFLGQHPDLRGLAMRERVQSMREGRPRETVKQRPDGVGGFLGLGGN